MSESSKAMQAKQAGLAAAEAQASKLAQELEQRQADSAASISAAEDKCRELQAAVNQVMSYPRPWLGCACSHVLVQLTIVFSKHGYSFV